MTERPPPPPAVIVHGLGEALAALTAAAALGTPVRVRSAPGASASLGVAGFLALAAAARALVPTADARFILDCDDNPGHAVAACRARAPAIRVRLAAPLRARVADIARETGVLVEDGDDPALDLGTTPDPLAASTKWLLAARKCAAEGLRPRCQGYRARVSQSGLFHTNREIEA